MQRMVTLVREMELRTGQESIASRGKRVRLQLYHLLLLLGDRLRLERVRELQGGR